MTFTNPKIQDPVVPPTATGNLDALPANNPAQPPIPKAAQPDIPKPSPISQQLGQSVSAVVDYQDAENIAFLLQNGTAVQLYLPTGNLKRQIYCYISGNNVGANYYVLAELVFYSAGAMKGKLPMNIGGGTLAGLNQSIVSSCTFGNEVQDTIGLYLSNPTGGQSATGIAVPALNISGSFDRIDLNIKGFSNNVTAVRVYLGCRSILTGE